MRNIQRTSNQQELILQENVIEVNESQIMNHRQHQHSNSSTSNLELLNALNENSNNSVTLYQNKMEYISPPLNNQNRMQSVSPLNNQSQQPQPPQQPNFATYPLQPSQPQPQTPQQSQQQVQPQQLQQYGVAGYGMMTPQQLQQYGVAGYGMIQPYGIAAQSPQYIITHSQPTAGMALRHVAADVFGPTFTVQQYIELFNDSTLMAR